MKFQRKQMLEREQKKLALTGGVTTNSDTSIPPKTNVGNGKVIISQHTHIRSSSFCINKM